MLRPSWKPCRKLDRDFCYFQPIFDLSFDIFTDFMPGLDEPRKEPQTVIQISIANRLACIVLIRFRV